MAIEEVGPDLMHDCPDHGLPVEKVGAKFIAQAVAGKLGWRQRYRCILGHVYDAPVED